MHPGTVEFLPQNCFTGINAVLVDGKSVYDAPVMLSLILLQVVLLVTTAFAQNLIVPGASWKDTSGTVIQAHGAGILKVRSYAWLCADCF